MTMKCSLANRRPAQIVHRLRKAGVPESYIEEIFAGHLKGPWRRPGEQPASPETKESSDAQS